MQETLSLFKKSVNMVSLVFSNIFNITNFGVRNNVFDFAVDNFSCTMSRRFLTFSASVIFQFFKKRIIIT